MQATMHPLKYEHIKAPHHKLYPTDKNRALCSPWKEPNNAISIPFPVLWKSTSNLLILGANRQAILILGI